MGQALSPVHRSSCETISSVSVRKRIEVQGIVQGVGFRPFVYRIAQRCQIHGWVLNSSGGVVIEAEGAAIDEFLALLRAELPPLARIDRLHITDRPTEGDLNFVIHKSQAITGHFALVPPDVATCPDCARDFSTPANRRFAYPFTNCTNCGPRYTIIRDVPYDRPNTTMADFRMCARCQAEYEDPLNRRFHAEPNACPDCGPSLALLTAAELSSGAEPVFAPAHQCRAILERARSLLREGRILAIKGLGGFHLACDATNETAVSLLRQRKRRNGKAFALMVPSLAAAERFCALTDADRQLLAGPRRPIVLLQRRLDSPIAPSTAPGNARLGVMLPYTPLHHLLFDDSLQALVMTSGNMSEEPIVSRNEDAAPRLNRSPIISCSTTGPSAPASTTPFFRSSKAARYPVRRSRGYAPDPIVCGAQRLPEVLACGGELKNTFCLTRIPTPSSASTSAISKTSRPWSSSRNLEHLQRFFRVTPVAVAHDLHPSYLSTVSR